MNQEYADMVRENRELRKVVEELRAEKATVVNEYEKLKIDFQNQSQKRIFRAEVAMNALNTLEELGIISHDFVVQFISFQAEGHSSDEIVDILKADLKNMQRT